MAFWKRGINRNLFKTVDGPKGFPVYSSDKKTTKKRLLARRNVDRKTGCWIWAGALHKPGYGHMQWNGKQVDTHRLSAWVWLDFDLESELDVLHKCDNPPCFNPEHFFFGTDEDNLRDCKAKGRYDPGQYQRSKTHCPQGHLYAETAVISGIEGKNRVRYCKLCKQEQARRKSGVLARSFGE